MGGVFASDSHPTSSSSGRSSIPTRNRFPEFAVDDEDEEAVDSSGSEPDYAIGFDIASDVGVPDEEEAMYTSGAQTLAAGQAQESETGRSAGNTWTIRNPTSSLWTAQSKSLPPSVNSSRSGVDMEVSPGEARIAERIVYADCAVLVK